MITVDQLLDFQTVEQRAAFAEGELNRLLTDEAIAERGDAILGLTLKESKADAISLDCQTNNSRFRIGSRLELLCDSSRLLGTVTNLMDQGRVLHLRIDRKPKTLPSGPWVAKEVQVDLSNLIRQCLRKLQPGAPGWTFFRTIGGDPVQDRQYSNLPDDQLIESTLRTVLSASGLSLDTSQRAAVERCLKTPAVLAVQGPPGTGKTAVLAVVAECLARMGKRTVILAPTHQAVNNALSTVHKLFPNRPTVKVGDELRRESLADDIDCKLLRIATKDVPPKLTSELIVGMTFVSGLHHLALRSSGLAPNVVIIEEAGQLPLLQGCCAGLIGAGSILLFGDDAQMPPVYPSELADSPLAQSLFSSVRAAIPGSVLMLDTTYRMNAEICGIVASSFYFNTASHLIPSAEAAARRFSLEISDEASESVRDILEAEASFVWVQTPNSTCRQSNVAEADIIAALIAAAIRAGTKSDDIAVVTPFRRQSALIRNRVQLLLGTAPSGLPIIDTVERVQGLTVDLVLISIATSDPDFAASLGRFLFSPNRLNVAISRARSKVVLACSTSALESIPSDYTGLLGQEVFRRVLAKAGHVVSPDASWRQPPQAGPG